MNSVLQKITYPRYSREQKLSAKLSDADILEIQQLRAQSTKNTHAVLGKQFNVNSETIRKALMTETERKNYYYKRYHAAKLSLKGVLKVTAKQRIKCRIRKKEIQPTVQIWENMKSKLYATTHKDTIREASKQYYITHRDEMLVKKKQYNLQHKNEIRLWQKQHKLLHKDEKRVYDKLRYKKMKSY